MNKPKREDGRGIHLITIMYELNKEDITLMLRSEVVETRKIRIMRVL